jgi:hypothetical protein
MFNRLALTLGGAAFAIGFSISAHTQSLPDADYMRQALAAGPDSVSKGASVVRPEQDGTMRTLRAGTNHFTCLIMGTDRMCVDTNAMHFIHAMMHKQPPPDQLGIAYMLGGDTGPSGEIGGASNTDPFAQAKTPNNHWVVTGPHIMLFGPPSKTLGLTRAEDPDPSQPYMMWANTPYDSKISCFLSL